MPLADYGVLAGGAVAKRREGKSDSPHYQIHLVDDAGTDYRIAVNALSQLAPSELLYVAVDDFRHPITETLPAAMSGWTALKSGPGVGGFDFVRGNLFDRAAMVALPADLPGVDNDLADRLDHYVDRAIADPTVAVYVFGQRWGPEEQIPDKIFGFRPGNGVHDIHMNQGNSGSFQRDDGIWQDGGLLLRFATPEPHWAAVFLAFQSQSWHTDDATGHTLTDVPQPIPGADGDARLRIVAALVNPVGPAPEAETVTLLNASPETIDLSGWTLADRDKHLLALPASPLPAGATLAVPLSPALSLGNNGGIITLLDPRQLKVHGVSYTREQADREGWTIAF
jgi:uncharacterized protein YukJ